MQTSILLAVVLELGWHVFRAVFNLFRWIYWNCSGVASRLAAAETSYEKSVHVRNIRLRHIFDELAWPLTELVFVTTHGSFEDPEYILRDDVTLCHVTKSHAYFVQTSEDVFDPRNGSFSTFAQFKCAEKLIVMPINAFHKLADTLPDPKKLICVANTLRCGGTLLGRVFQDAGNCRFWCESNAVTALQFFCTSLSLEDRERMVRSTFKILCKPIQADVGETQPSSYMFKFLSTNIMLLPLIQSVFPDARFIFMYRNFIPNVKSLNKVMLKSPVFYLLSRSLLYLPFVLKKMFYDINAMMNLAIPFPGKLHCDTDVASFLTAHNIKVYMHLRETGLAVTALKYEDFLSNPREVCEQLIIYTGVALNSERTLDVMQHDSQTVSYVSRDQLAGFQGEEPTPENVAFSRCLFRLWCMDEDILNNTRIPGTLKI